MKSVDAPRRGFALAELGVVLAVVLAIAALVVLLSSDGRRLGRLGDDLGKLRRIGALTGQYGADHADRFWTFSWRAGESHSQYPELNNAPTDLVAAANQAIDILRRRTGRTDLVPIQAWYPHSGYAHLVLLDADAAALPDLTFVSAADGNRLRWARDPAGFDAGLYQPMPSGFGSSAFKRWPYSASFQVPTAFFDRSTPQNRVYNSNTHTMYQVPGGAVLGARTMSEVAFPGQKVHVHDSNARHFGVKQPFSSHEQARLPLLLCDGGVLVRSAGESNAGWHPAIPHLSQPLSFFYQPAAWEPGTFSGAATEQVSGRFRYTRGTATEHGIAGRDFGGPETCSGQPGCP